jgi:urocanate hydratase
MYGQMTAGSWIYIGSQGIVQGTYETFAALARKHFGGTLAGKIVVSGGMGGMGGAQPLAATMNGACFLGVDVDPQRIQKRIESGYCDRLSRSLAEALDILITARTEGKPLAVGLVGNCADVLPELVRTGFVPDVLTDQTSAHDPLNGYIPNGMTFAEALALRVRTPKDYVERSFKAMGTHVEAMLALQQKGAVTFDYGNNLRTHAKQAGVERAFNIPGFVPEYIRPLFCEGRGPRFPAIRKISTAPIVLPSKCSRTTRRWSAGFISPPLAFASRACRPESAGSAMANVPNSAWP